MTATSATPARPKRTGWADLVGAEDFLSGGQLQLLLEIFVGLWALFFNGLKNLLDEGA